MYQLRTAAETQAPLAMELINQAKAFLKAQGIDQWQNGYPDFECIQRDIRHGKGYFLTNDSNAVLAYMCIDFDGEPAYNALNGAWLTGQDACYAVVHRLAVDQTFRGKGIASHVFNLVQDMCAMKGVTSIRIDTDADNTIMKHLLNKNGFTYCGTICFDNSEKIAFEKAI